jgi:hypothetical protein
VPDPSATPVPDPLVAATTRAQALLAARLDQAPATPAERPALVEALQALVSPTGQLAVLGRVAADDLPALHRAAGGPAMPGVPALDTAWLPVVAAVREPLARLQLHQLAAGTAAGAGPALEPWSSKPTDPWQQDASDPSRLVVAYAASGLDLAALTGGDIVAAAVCERFTEVIPAVEQSTATAFGFDAPAARAPQAILLAVPPDLGAPLDDESLRDVVLETRELAHARMARPADLDEGARGMLPSVLLPAEGPLSVPLEPQRP